MTQKITLQKIAGLIELRAFGRLKGLDISWGRKDTFGFEMYAKSFSTLDAAMQEARQLAARNGCSIYNFM